VLKITSIELKFSSKDEIELQCLNIDETFRIKNNWSEGLSVSIANKEIDKKKRHRLTFGDDVANDKSALIEIHYIESYKKYN
jgi:hypothetical protein